MSDPKDTNDKLINYLGLGIGGFLIVQYEPIMSLLMRLVTFISQELKATKEIVKKYKYIVENPVNSNITQAHKIEITVHQHIYILAVSDYKQLVEVVGTLKGLQKKAAFYSLGSNVVTNEKACKILTRLEDCIGERDKILGIVGRS